MLTFRPLSLTDKPWIDRHVADENSRSADFNFGSMFLWDDRYQQWVADSDHHLISLCRAYPQPIFPYPIGIGNPFCAVEEMHEYAEANGFPLVIRGLEEHHVAALTQLFPGRFSYTEDRDYADYLYSIDKLVSLSGKHLHGKRNHCNRFESEHNWSFRQLKCEDFPACLALLDRWAAEEDAAQEAAIDGERLAIGRALEYYDVLGLLGGVLFAEGDLIAFAIGEPICTDTFDIHFEKACADINGAYSMINREFARLISQSFPNIHYVNREDDMGLDNLRRSKESYHQDILLRKFTARWNENV